MRSPIPVAGIFAFILVCCCGWAAAGEQAEDEAIAWAGVKDSQSSLEVRGFARAFPRGRYFGEAVQRYIQLARGTFPAETLNIQVRYPNQAAALPFSVGSRVVTLDVLVQPDGKAGAIKITKPSGFDPIDRAAVGAARRGVYLPAVENGVAVSAHLPLTINFRLLCPGEYSLVSCKDGEFQ